jgi:hypothetical protein
MGAGRIIAKRAEDTPQPTDPNHRGEQNNTGEAHSWASQMDTGFTGENKVKRRRGKTATN